MYGNVIDSATDNIPTTFTTAAGSRVISSSSSGGFLGIINYTSDTLAVVVGNYQDTAVPVSTLPGRCVFIPFAPSGSNGSAAMDYFKVSQGDSVFIRATGGSAITSGKVFVFVK